MTAILTTALLAALATSAGPPKQKATSASTQIPDRAVLLQQAAEAQQAGRLADAARFLRLAAEKHQSVHAYLELARLQSRGGEAAAALDSITKARAIAPNSEDVLSAYAQLALAAKLPVPALVTLQALTRMYPSVPQYHYLLGVALMGLGDMPTAVEALTEAARLEPDRPLTLIALGLALNHRKLFAEAKSALGRGLELQPDNVDGIAALAEAEAGLGELEAATAHAKQVLDRNPAHATANLVMGLVLMEQREYVRSRDALRAAIETDPEAHKALYQLSLVYARLGDDASARKYVELYREKLRRAEERLEALYEKRTLSR
jgi:tetratricopeptide (TPR) repeat protein